MKKHLYDILADGATATHELITDAMVVPADAGLDKERIAALATDKLGLSKRQKPVWYKQYYKQLAAVAACFVLVFAVVVAVMISGDVGTYTIEEDIVRPPVRETDNKIHSMLLFIPIEEYAEVADAIVRLKVGNWLGESYFYDETYYFAEIIDVYKGDVPENIILSQVGTSRQTHSGFPLFTYGEELILFLGKYDSPKNITEGMVLNVDISKFDVNNIYGIYGRYLNTWNVASLDSGKSYVVPMTPETVERNELVSTMYGLTNYGSTSQSGINLEAKNAAQKLISIDPYDNPGEEPKYMFELDAFVGYLKEISK